MGMEDKPVIWTEAEQNAREMRTFWETLKTHNKLENCAVNTFILWR